MPTCPDTSCSSCKRFFLTHRIQGIDFLRSRRQGDPSYNKLLRCKFQQLDSVLGTLSHRSHANGSHPCSGPVACHNMLPNARNLTLTAAADCLCRCWGRAPFLASGASGRHALGSCPRPFRWCGCVRPALHVRFGQPCWSGCGARHFHQPSSMEAGGCVPCALASTWSSCTFPTGASRPAPARSRLQSHAHKFPKPKIPSGLAGTSPACAQQLECGWEQRQTPVARAAAMLAGWPLQTQGLAMLCVAPALQDSEAWVHPEAVVRSSDVGSWREANVYPCSALTCWATCKQKTAAKVVYTMNAPFCCQNQSEVATCNWRQTTTCAKESFDMCLNLHYL